MEREEVIEKVIAVIRDGMDVIQGEMDEDTEMQGDLNIDSLDFYSLLGALESNFHIRMPEKELANTETIGDIADAVIRRMGK